MARKFKSAEERVRFRDRTARRMQKAFDKGQLSWGFKIGIFQRRVVKYGMVHEAKHHFMREAMDQFHIQNDGLLNVLNLRMISGKQWFDIALRAATDHAVIIKDKIESIPLLKSGALSKSIDVRRLGRSRKVRSRLKGVR